MKKRVLGIEHALLMGALVLAGCPEEGGPVDAGPPGDQGTPDMGVDSDPDLVEDQGPAPTCGDGTVDPGEECDGAELGGASCESLGHGPGTLVCSAACELDDSGCGTCGNSTVDDGEECDDGNADDGDGCSSQCLTEESCGDGVAGAAEACDGDDLKMTTCGDRGFAGGDLACTDLCEFDEAGCLASVCDNAVIEAPEECDGTELGGTDCEALGYAGGTLACGADCTFDTAQCESCGNGMADFGDVCDGADLLGESCETQGFAGGTLACLATCDAFDTAACVPAPCTFTVPEMGGRAQAIVAGNDVILTYETSAPGAGQARIDSSCQGTTTTLLGEATPVYPALGAAGSLGAFYLSTGAVFYLPDDMAGGYAAAVDLGITVGNQIHATGFGADHGVYAGNTFHHVSAAGSVVASYTVYNTAAFTLLDTFAHDDGAGQMYAAALVQAPSAPFHAALEIGKASTGTGTVATARSTRAIAYWNDAASAPIIAYAEFSDGTLQEWLRESTSPDISVATMQGVTLSGLVTGTVTPSGGTLTDFVVGTNDTDVFMLANVDDAGTLTTRAFRFSDRANGPLDLTGGIELGAGSRELLFADATSSDAVFVYRESGTLRVTRVAKALFP